VIVYIYVQIIYVQKLQNNHKTSSNTIALTQCRCKCLNVKW